MCVIVFQPDGSHLEKSEAWRGWAKNPDGGGFAYIDNNGQLQVYKNMEFDPFWRAFETARSANPRADFMLHMRIATHGSVSIENVHPFFTNEAHDTVMFHNGIFHEVEVPEDEDISDTRMFIRDVLPLLPENWLDEPYLVSMVEEWIGWSRVGFLTTNPALKYQAYVLNEKEGEYYKGMWASNKSLEAIKSYGGIHTTGGYVEINEKEMDRYDHWWESRPALVDSTGSKTLSHKERIAEQNRLESIRMSKGIYSELFWDPVEEHFECWGCEEVADPSDGECQCWNKICLDCEDYVANCTCDYSNNMIWKHDADEELMATVIEKATQGYYLGESDDERSEVSTTENENASN